MIAIRATVCLLLLSSVQGFAQSNEPRPKQSADGTPWYLKPVVSPPIPASAAKSAHPIDAFIAAQHQAKGLKPVGQADRRTLLRRVHLDLIGIPPTIAEQEAFLKDESANAYEKVVDRLLASEQHGVRYARHWLDVLRYADVDEGMIAAPGIHLWRDWVINALNNDVPYDQFVTAQLTGYRSSARTEVSALGFQERIEPRADDIFALGFLSRGAVVHGDKEIQELPIAAVETISTAFMGMTVGCAKCHDHEYDPITQRDFYTMKALFDPLALKKVTLANPAEAVAQGKKLDALDKKLAAVEKPIQTLIAPYKKKLLDERIAQLPADVRAVILKPAKERSVAEEKIADDYFPILRIDVSKIMLIMPEAEREKYRGLVKEFNQLQQVRSAAALPVFWTVEIDRKKELEKSYILTSGDPLRPQKKHEVGPGWPFAPAKIEFRAGRIETFADWLTAPANPLFARVAVNRLWQWHFGEGLQKTPNDFGKLGGVPSNPLLLDWLASEFVRQKFSMKAMHRLIVTSDAYQMASDGGDANAKIDPANAYLWRYRLRGLDAETVWDSIFSAAGTLDQKVGGRSFDPKTDPARRGAYMIRGYASNREVMPAFLQAFDAEDGRAPCPLRTRTVTAPQSLFLMNSGVIDTASTKFAERLKQAAGNDLKAAVTLGYRTAIARPPSAAEMDRALSYLDNDAARLPGFAWLLFNLDEFVFVR
jgi:Protein of unknown function (DUF1553)/Protein of unknown function (DUF1549)